MDHTRKQRVGADGVLRWDGPMPRGLGQTTELARNSDTVNLGSAVLPTLVLSGAVIGIGWLAWKALRR